jgi:hypothetical protein
MAAVDPAFARSVARWLRAYPRRWRSSRTAEVTDLLADLAPPGARRLDVRSGLGLVRAGWATRWREHPPPVPYLRYLLLDRPLDPRYRDWVLDDVEGPWFAARRALGVTSLLMLVVVAAPMAVGAEPSLDFARTFIPIMLLQVALWARRWQERAVTRQLVVQPGDVVTASSRLPGLVARPRLAARPWLSAALTVAVVLLAVNAVLLASDPVVPALVVGAAGVAGLLLAGPAARRLRRWQPVDQPYRWVVQLSPTGRTRVAALLLASVVHAVAQPEIAALVALPQAAASAVAVPVLLAARRRVAAGRTRAVAGIEVVRALQGGGDPVDRPVGGHVPAAAWLPVGAVVPAPADEAPGPGLTSPSAG